MSWRQLLDIYREAADDAREEASRRPTACPIDGEPLIAGQDGLLACPRGNWREATDG